MSGRRRQIAPALEADFARIVRDTARVAIPKGGVYDSVDFLLHQPGMAQKRGGTSYAGPALTGSTFVVSLAHVPFASGAQLIAMGSNNHLYKITAGLTTDLGATNNVYYGRPAISPGGKYLVLSCTSGNNAMKYDGAAITPLTGGGLTLSHLSTYKSRVLASSTAPGIGFPNRIFFSPVPDINATWDTTNSWIDADNPITGFATLNNALLIFSAAGMERIIGATPPPLQDMDRAPVYPIGCTDVRSIVTVGPYVFFANPQGVWYTTGGKPGSLTAEGGIDALWQSLFVGQGYIAAAPEPLATTWTIAAGYLQGFLFVSVLNDARVLQGAFMCDVATRSWTRLTNIKAMCFATSVDGTELYYGDAATNRVVKMSGVFVPTSANKADADGTSIAPVLELRPVGDGPGIKSFGFGRVSYDMRDAASDNPALQINVKTGVEADVSSLAPESPLLETTTLDRKRFTVGKDAQGVTVLLTQFGASAKTEIYAVEVEQRPHSFGADGIS